MRRWLTPDTSTSPTTWRSNPRDARHACARLASGWPTATAPTPKIHRVRWPAVAGPGRLVAADARQPAGAPRCSASQMELCAGVATHRAAIRPGAVAAAALARQNPMDVRRGSCAVRRRTLETLSRPASMQAEEGTLVRAVRDAVVAAPLAATEFGTLVESGTGISAVAYVHVRVGRRNAHGSLIDQWRLVGWSRRPQAGQAWRRTRFAAGGSRRRPGDQPRAPQRWLAGAKVQPAAAPAGPVRRHPCRRRFAAAGFKLFDESGALFQARGALAGRVPRNRRRRVRWVRTATRHRVWPLHGWL